MNDSKVAPVEAQAVPDLPVAWRWKLKGSHESSWQATTRPLVDDERDCLDIEPLFTRPTPAAADLHQQIMNLPCDDAHYTHEEAVGYRMGHRDARHAAAQLVAASPAAAAGQQQIRSVHLAATQNGEDFREGSALSTPVDTNKCLPNGVLFDAFGNTRVRYVRVIHDGTTCVVPPQEVESLVDSERAYNYRTEDVYLSKEEFDGLPEFDGF